METDSDRLAKATADSLQAAAIGTAARARSDRAYKNARWSLATPRDCAGFAAAAQEGSAALADAPCPLGAAGTDRSAPTPAPPRLAARQISRGRSCAALGAGERRRFAAVQETDKRAPIQPAGDRRAVSGPLHVGVSPTARGWAPASSRWRLRLTAEIVRIANRPESPKAAAEPVVGRRWPPVTIREADVMRNTALAEPAAKDEPSVLRPPPSALEEDLQDEASRTAAGRKLVCSSVPPGAADRFRRTGIPLAVNPKPGVGADKNSTRNKFCSWDRTPQESWTMVSNQAEAPEALRILLVDKSPIHRASFPLFFGNWTKEKGCAFEISQAVSSVDQLETPAEAHLVLLSIGATPASVPEVWDEITKLGLRVPETPIVVLSDREDSADVISTVRAGARGFMTMRMDPLVMFRALSLISCGGTFFPPTALLERPSGSNDSGPAASVDATTIQRTWTGGIVLTARQSEVLQLLTEGCSNKRIALRLRMCEATVKVHVRLIMRKFGVSNRTQVALYARGFCTATQRDIG